MKAYKGFLLRERIVETMSAKMTEIRFDKIGVSQQFI